MSSVYIVGPTASGKSDLAMLVAKKYGGEIVCADSQTIRKDMDVGTAKPSSEDRQSIAHHMLDIIDPYDRYSVAEFKSAAQSIVKDIQNRKKLPVVVGGTGLYVDSLLYDFQFRKTVSAESRSELEAMSVVELQSLIADRNLDLPENKMNPRHLIRTLESAGQSSIKNKIISGAIVVGIDPGKELLLDRIIGRAQQMLDNGLLTEFEQIIDTYGMPKPEFEAISYRIIMQHRVSKGHYDVEGIKKQLVVSDRQYAKQQRAWLKRNRDIIWFEQPNEALEYLDGILHNH